jgi:hypothetical protein
MQLLEAVHVRARHGLGSGRVRLVGDGGGGVRELAELDEPQRALVAREPRRLLRRRALGGDVAPERAEKRADRRELGDKRSMRPLDRLGRREARQQLRVLGKRARGRAEHGAQRVGALLPRVVRRALRRLERRARGAELIVRDALGELRVGRVVRWGHA